MKKKFRQDDLIKFKELHTSLVSLETWTKEKHEKKKELLSFLKKFRSWLILRKNFFPKFTDGKDFLCWDYELATIPNTKTGFFYDFRNQTVLILCISHLKYGIKEIVVIPTFFENNSKS